MARGVIELARQTPAPRLAPVGQDADEMPVSREGSAGQSCMHSVSSPSDRADIFMLPMITLLEPNDSRAFRTNTMSAMMRDLLCCGLIGLARSSGARAASSAFAGVHL